MLTRSFMSAADLGIAEETRSALIRVLHMLERGELVHVNMDHLEPTLTNGFSMEVWDCGTAACIGGWADRLGADIGHTTNGLKALLYPSDDHAYAAVPAQAAIALSSYLTTGWPRWEEAMK